MSTSHFLGKNFFNILGFCDCLEFHSRPVKADRKKVNPEENRSSRGSSAISGSLTFHLTSLRLQDPNTTINEALRTLKSISKQK